MRVGGGGGAGRKAPLSPPRLRCWGPPTGQPSEEPLMTNVQMGGARLGYKPGHTKVSTGWLGTTGTDPPDELHQGSRINQSPIQSAVLALRAQGHSSVSPTLGLNAARDPREPRDWSWAAFKDSAHYLPGIGGISSGILEINPKAIIITQRCKSCWQWLTAQQQEVKCIIIHTG